MPALIATTDTERIEAPVTFKAYLMCAFASFGGIFFGYDIGYISSVMAMPYFIHTFTGKPYPPATAADDFALSPSNASLITSILSAGTFIGAIVAGDLADFIGRKYTILSGCFIFIVGIILQTASTSVGLLSAGRAIAGLGVGFESAIVILYMSEIAPRKVRGALVAGYQFCITIGLLLASCVDYSTQSRLDSGSYRIPIATQFLWALILGGGIAWLPESPRYYVKRGRLDKAIRSLTSLRGQPDDSEFVQAELAEIVANHEYELQVIPQVCFLSCPALIFRVSNHFSGLIPRFLGKLLQRLSLASGQQSSPHDPRHLLANDATMDRRKLHLLLWYKIFRPIGHNLEPILDRSYHDFGQCSLNSDIVLDY